MPRIAVLIDAENASAKIVDGLFEEIAKIGEASVRRIWRLRQRTLKGLDRCACQACDHSTAAVWLHDGKNASDITLVIDAMESAVQWTLRRLLPRLVRQRFRFPRLQKNFFKFMKPTIANVRPGGEKENRGVPKGTLLMRGAWSTDTRGCSRQSTNGELVTIGIIRWIVLSTPT
ncbi:NYN domain-containing protein [Sinorhizobium fredii]|uniref:NYN domain-containing protein n=1 Tax=Rhizobium fredii TaxID=380 RepID=UPI003CC76B9A